MKLSQGFIITIIVVLGLAAQFIPGLFVGTFYDDPAWIAAGFPFPFAWEGPRWINYNTKETGFSWILLTIDLSLIPLLAIVAGRKWGSIVPSNLTRNQFIVVSIISIVLILFFAILYNDVLSPVNKYSKYF